MTLALGNVSNRVSGEPWLQWDASRYEIQKELGRGQYGVVFLARDKERNKERKGADELIVIKQMNRDTTDLTNLRGEIASLQRLSNSCKPYILCFKNEIFQDNKYYYLITDFLGNQFRSLESVKAEMVKKPSMLCSIVVNLIRGLQLIHSKDVAHRDVKPTNILVNVDDGAIRYIDFGFACVDKQGCARGFVLQGTPEFEAPEILLNQVQASLQAFQKSDLWALGLTIYEVVMPEMHEWGVANEWLAATWRTRFPSAKDPDHFETSDYEYFARRFYFVPQDMSHVKFDPADPVPKQPDPLNNSHKRVMQRLRELSDACDTKTIGKLQTPLSITSLLRRHPPMRVLPSIATAPPPLQPPSLSLASLAASPTTAVQPMSMLQKTQIQARLPMIVEESPTLVAASIKTSMPGPLTLPPPLPPLPLTLPVPLSTAMPMTIVRRSSSGHKATTVPTPSTAVPMSGGAYRNQRRSTITVIGNQNLGAIYHWPRRYGRPFRPSLSIRPSAAAPNMQTDANRSKLRPTQ
jgi:serine/threonine protein kinase